MTRRYRGRAPSITVSGATETLGERVKTPVNENDDEDSATIGRRRGHVRPKIHELPGVTPRHSKSALYLERYARYTTQFIFRLP